MHFTGSKMFPALSRLLTAGVVSYYVLLAIATVIVFSYPGTSIIVGDPPIILITDGRDPLLWNLAFQFITYHSGAALAALAIINTIVLLGWWICKPRPIYATRASDREDKLVHGFRLLGVQPRGTPGPNPAVDLGPIPVALSLNYDDDSWIHDETVRMLTGSHLDLPAMSTVSNNANRFFYNIRLLGRDCAGQTRSNGTICRAGTYVPGWTAQRMDEFTRESPVRLKITSDDWQGEWGIVLLDDDGGWAWLGKTAADGWRWFRAEFPRAADSIDLVAAPVLVVDTFVRRHWPEVRSSLRKLVSWDTLAVTQPPYEPLALGPWAKAFRRFWQWSFGQLPGLRSAAAPTPSPKAQAIGSAQPPRPSSWYWSVESAPGVDWTSLLVGYLTILSANWLVGVTLTKAVLLEQSLHSLFLYCQKVRRFYMRKLHSEFADIFAAICLAAVSSFLYWKAPDALLLTGEAKSQAFQWAPEFLRSFLIESVEAVTFLLFILSISPLFWLSFLILGKMLKMVRRKYQ